MNFEINGNRTGTRKDYRGLYEFTAVERRESKMKCRYKGRENEITFFACNLNVFLFIYRSLCLLFLISVLRYSYKSVDVTFSPYVFIERERERERERESEGVSVGYSLKCWTVSLMQVSSNSTRAITFTIGLIHLKKI